MSIEPIIRYGKTDLQEFGEVITQKLSIAQNDLDELRSSLVHYSGNGTDDTSFSSHNMEEGNGSLEREELMMLATRQGEVHSSVEECPLTDAQRHIRGL